MLYLLTKYSAMVCAWVGFQVVAVAAAAELGSVVVGGIWCVDADGAVILHSNAATVPQSQARQRARADSKGSR